MWLHKKNGDEICEWRKANQIHNWFIVNCDADKNRGEEVIISREQLKVLLNTITEILENKTLAEQKLPTASGFFWGGTDYDEWYFKDLVDTQKALAVELNENDDEEYLYSSSW